MGSPSVQQELSAAAPPLSHDAVRRGSSPGEGGKFSLIIYRDFVFVCIVYLTFVFVDELLFSLS